MGLTYIVHRLSPESLERVRAEHREHPDLDWAGARRLFAELGREQPPCGAASSWDEYEFLFEFEGWSLVALLAASEASWDLDKSLDRPGDGLPAVAALLPELAPVGGLLRALHTLDAVQLPRAFQGSEQGLVGIATAELVLPALPVAARFAEPEARELVANAPLPWFKRLLGGSATLQAWRNDSYLWDNWCRLLQAVRDAGTRKHWLGLELR